MKTVQFSETDLSLDYEMAKAFADLVVNYLTKEAVVVAWYYGQKCVEHAQVPEYQHKPGWLAYAERHGGDIKIDIIKLSLFLTLTQ